MFAGQNVAKMCPTFDGGSSPVDLSVETCSAPSDRRRPCVAEYVEVAGQRAFQLMVVQKIGETNGFFYLLLA